MLPFFSSAIVPADKMGPGVRQFAEYQPFTPIIETLRGLLNGSPGTGDLVAALAWCVGDRSRRVPVGGLHVQEASVTSTS